MSARRYLNNKVATSSFLLPVAIVLSLLLWFSQGISDLMVALGWVACLSCAVLMMELNNKNVLLRVRSRMVSATFVVLWSACLFLHPLQWGNVATLCLILSYHSLFHAYQQAYTSVDAFNAFLSLGVCVVLVPQMAIFVLPLMASFAWFQALNPRSFSAMLLGLFAPLWVGAGIAFWDDSLSVFLQHLIGWWQWSLTDYSVLTFSQVSMAVLLLVLNVIAVIHTQVNSFQDKIRTRMLYNFLCWMSIVLFAMVLAFPKQFNVMFSLFLMNSSPLLAHFFTLARHKVVNILFWTTLLVLIVLYMISLWMPSFSF